MSRNVLLDAKEGVQETLPELVFARMSQPKVLLGAPGGGKSKVCNEIATQLEGRLVNADELIFDCVNEDPGFPGQILIVDGLDEVVSDEVTEAFPKILQKILQLGYSNWLVSCRSCEWRPKIFDRQIQYVFKKKAIVAYLKDLANEEVENLLKLFSKPGDAEQLMKAAINNEATDLLRNPQTLQLLVEAVENAGWPETKKELFNTACQNMAGENNEIHKEKSVDRSTSDQKIETAGWICAQLLMSGGQGIALGGESSKIYHRPTELSSDEYSADKIRETCKTKLFRPAQSSNVVAIHRTVAEFLAGRWLARAFSECPPMLSSRRVLSCLSFGAGEVPSALKGLHAWITSLTPISRTENIERDPFGCLMYGDLSGFSDGDVKCLFAALRTLSKVEPHSRNQEKIARFDRNLGRDSIKRGFIGIISDDSVSPHLKCTLLDAIQRTDFAENVTEELQAIALNENATSSERIAAVDALPNSLKGEDWRALADKLLESRSMKSLSISLDKVISNHHKYFSGDQIADHISVYVKIYSDLNLLSPDPRMFDVSCRLAKKCDDRQVADIAISLAKGMPECFYRTRIGMYGGLEKCLLDFFQQILLRDCDLTTDDLWTLVSRLSGCSYRHSKWEEVAQSWFYGKDEVRRQIQSSALSYAKHDQLGCDAIPRLSKISAGLHPNEADVVHHMNKLVDSNDKPCDWLDKWECLVYWVLLQQGSYDSAIALAKEQAAEFKYLQPLLDNLLRPPTRTLKRFLQECKKERQEEEQHWAAERHTRFTAVRESIRTGENLEALHEAAVVYLGRGHSKVCVPPRERLVEWVGWENFDSITSGFQAAFRRSDVQPVFDYSTALEHENKECRLEDIALALCVEIFFSGGSLSSLPRDTLLCALLACRWGFHLTGIAREAFHPKLEEILFDDSTTKLTFIGDTIEPSLRAGEICVLGLERVLKEVQFADILPSLVIKWLSQSNKLSEHSAWKILRAAVRLPNTSDLVDLVEERLGMNAFVNADHRAAWIAAAFVIDFQRFRSHIALFAGEGKETLWEFKKIESEFGTDEQFFRNLTVEQIHFLIEAYAPQWPVVSLPPTRFGIRNDWDAAGWIARLINLLGDLSNEGAIERLKALSKSNKMGSHQTPILHSLANARQVFAEKQHAEISLKDVRSILLSCQPISANDLKIIFLEEIKSYQEKIKTGPSCTYLTYWEADKPSLENYCRDRLLDGLEQSMQNYGVSVHKEGAISSKGRVDLLLSLGNIVLPVEIKCQWHRNLWTGACNQLENYSKDYRSNGVGVYLVIWHGHVEDKERKPKRHRGAKRPKNANEMYEALYRNLPRKLSSATKIVVLDVSKQP